jgi:hypothetical protein
MAAKQRDAFSSKKNPAPVFILQAASKFSRARLFRVVITT